MLILCLSAPSFGMDTQDGTYDNLLSSVKAANYVKFKELYSENYISRDQKNELLDLVDGIIATEYNYWRSNTFAMPESSAGKDLRMAKKFGYIFTGCFGLITPVMIGFVLRNYFIGKSRIENKYHNLRSGKTNLYWTAATHAIDINIDKKFWMTDIMAQAFCVSCMGLLGIVFFAITKLNHKVLYSYKRWKKSCKIKKIIQDSIFNLEFVQGLPLNLVLKANA